MGALQDAPHVHVESADAWREWLAENHATAAGVWLVRWKPSTGRPAPTYEASVEEALCFGWIDSQAGSVDGERTRQYFAPRKAGSGWARPNKERIERLLAAGRMAPAGLAALERARGDGSWTLLDAVERLELPDDLAAALDGSPPAREHWDTFPRTVRRAALASLVAARREATRTARIAAIVTRAQRGERPGT
jgi:uncharacterized protein YdeI (YjbR/CyaY-like superfamily)